MIRVKRNKKYMYILILFLILGIGFAVLAANLKINGTVNIDAANWDVHFENVQVTEGSVEANPAPTSDDTTTTEMTYTINFTKPGDFFEFTTDIANDGTIDAMVNLVTNKVYASDGTTEKALPAYLKSTVTYNDGTPINKNHLLSHETSEKIKVRVEFKSDVNPGDLPSSADTIVFKFEGDFKQADENACPKATSFQDDSWETIQCNVKQNTQSYAVGSTKNIEMDLDNDNTNETYTLRVANNTTPSECSTQGFSQTACGFVVEFKDVILEQAMYSKITSTGGWESSDIRKYLNSEDAFISKLPTKLKNSIIDTTVISGHNNLETSNFNTTDKIYLLDSVEIYGSSFIDSKHTAKEYERQLDYYNEQGISERNYIGAAKEYQNRNNTWWLRSSSTDGEYYFFLVTSSGSSYNDTVNVERGVSPAFRIG